MLKYLETWHVGPSCWSESAWWQSITQATAAELFLLIPQIINFYQVFPEGLWMSLPSHLDCAKFPSSKHWIANKNSILNPSWYIQYTQSPAGQHTKNKYTCVSVISCHLLTLDTCSGTSTRGHEIVHDVSLFKRQTKRQTLLLEDCGGALADDPDKRQTMTVARWRRGGVIALWVKANWQRNIGISEICLSFNSHPNSHCEGRNSVMAMTMATKGYD